MKKPTDVKTELAMSTATARTEVVGFACGGGNSCKDTGMGSGQTGPG
jgi:hypothetical protein